MVLATLQLQTIGEEDIYLTKNPEINIFKYSYFRYLNFANDIYRFHFNDTPRFGGSYTVTIPKYGHLLTKLFIRISLPTLQKTGGDYACWSDALAFAIFDGPIELLINGNVVDRMYPVCMDLLDELESSPSNKGHNNMILKSDTYVGAQHNAEREIDLIIPLTFWFTKQYPLALPIAAMYHDTISIRFNFHPFEKVINYDVSPPDFKEIISADFIGEYITLDSAITDSIINTPYTFVTSQTLYNGEEVVSSNKQFHTTKINFKNICKEILFCFVTTQNIQYNNYFNYSRSDESPFLKEVSILIDSKHRYADFLPESVFRYIMPDSYHSTVPVKYFYTIPFAIKPEDYSQPTGGINMGRLSDVVLSFKLKEDNEECKLYVFAICYQIVRIKDGHLEMLFL